MSQSAEIEVEAEDAVFCVVWQLSDTASQVAERLSMPPDRARSWAWHWREFGVPLKEMPDEEDVDLPEAPTAEPEQKIGPAKPYAYDPETGMWPDGAILVWSKEGFWDGGTGFVQEVAKAKKFQPSKPDFEQGVKDAEEATGVPCRAFCLQPAWLGR